MFDHIRSADRFVLLLNTVLLMVVAVLPFATSVVAEALRSGTVELETSLGRRLPPGHEAALYFVALEALTNVTKYAGASAAEVTLRGGGRWAEITIADDGCGGAGVESGSGLRGLVDRVEALGGRLVVTSASGAGTIVLARLPLASGDSIPRTARINAG